MITSSTQAKPIRAINPGRESRVARLREELYRNCIARVNEAMEKGFALEAIALIESMICDRLESRLAFIHSQCHEKRKFSTLGKLKQELLGRSANEPAEAKEMYAKVSNWAAERNKALHEFAKLSEADELLWDEKYDKASSAANDGLRLFRQLDKLIWDLNKPPGLTAGKMAP